MALLLVRIGLPLVLATLTALAALGVVHLLRLLAHDDSERDLAFDFLIGVPLCGTLFFLIACISTAPPVMAAALFGCAALGVAAVIRRQRGAGEVIEPSVAGIAALIEVAIVVAGALLVAQLPAFSLDEVAYHLAVPKTWVLEGHVVDLPLLSHSYFPFGSESSALPALALLHDDGAVAAHFLSVAILAAAWWSLLRWLRTRTAPGVASVAAAAIVTTPALAITAGFAWADWPLAGVVIALLVTIDRSIRSGEVRRLELALAIAAGMLTKYTFMGVAGPLLMAFAIAIPREQRKRLLVGVISGAAAGSIFLVRNAVLTGNPLAPFFERNAPAVAQFRSSVLSYLLDRVTLDESLGIGMLLVIILGLAAIGRWKSDRFVTASLALLAVATIGTAALHPSSRILVPFLLSAAAIAAIGIQPRRATAVVLLAVVALQVALVLYCWKSVEPWVTLTRGMTNPEYLARGGPYRDIVRVEVRLPPDARVLVIGFNELFWFDVRVRGGGNFDGPRVAAYLAAGTPEDLRRRLAGDGITHIALFSSGLGTAPEAFRERSTALPPQARRNLSVVMRTAGTPLLISRETVLYRLR